MSAQRTLSFAPPFGAHGAPHVADAREVAIRKQTALVRSLLDEIDRCPAGDRWLAPLVDQLDEEVTRLRRLVASDRPA